MDKPTISVAMCTYNGERYLVEQLNSLLTQTCLPNELVICDDGSTDGTLEILENFQKNVLFKVLIHKNEKSLGTAKATFLCVTRTMSGFPKKLKC
jgi:glycosyltransferase involved in cell wall biosynthesis